MGENTKIQWTATPRPDGTLAPGYTYNRWIGCTKISPGCANCYASVDTTARVSRGKGVELWGPNAARKQKAVSTRDEPLRWDRAAKLAGERRKVFAASLSDVFEDRPDLTQPRIELFRLMHATPNLDWLLLTKRPETLRKVVRDCLDAWPIDPLSGKRRDTDYWYAVDWIQGGEPSGKVPSNLWLGVSVEDRKHGLPRIDALRTIPAAVRFLSIEPLLEDLGEIDLTGIGWVIVGGESGPNARPFNLAWAWSLRDQCEAAGVPFFMKQMGSRPYDSSLRVAEFVVELSLKDSHGGDPDEWPDLNVREFPRPAVVA